jgi:hypothetical protein
VSNNDEDTWTSIIKTVDVVVDASMSKPDPGAFTKKLVNAISDPSRPKRFVYTSGCLVFGEAGLNFAHIFIILLPYPFLSTNSHLSSCT